ncbi:MAG: hypothetical protein RB191_18700 [Terriglobia bacterium]|nr:hypothetical protein [Terriglobia bacterium]
MPKYTIGDAPKQPAQSPAYTIGDAPPQTPDEQPQENSFQRGVDQITQINPANQTPGFWGHALTGIETLGGGVLSPLSLIAHPIRSAKMAVNSVQQGASLSNANPIFADTPSMQDSIAQGMHDNPSGTIENLIGGAMGGRLLGEIPGAASAAREAALGDPDAAALRGLRVGPSSPKALRTLSAVEGARPFLAGTKNLEDLQGRIPAAKAEIWKPYQEAVNKVGDRIVTGPDGPISIRDLEAERAQLSALNRGLKSGNPEALQLAQQKGMTAAQLLEREKAVQNALDPVLQEAGIDPFGIRKSFGQVKTVEGRVAGKSTLVEPKEPYGLGKIVKPMGVGPQGILKFRNPLGGFRDIAAGRPWWSGRPTDINLREAFRPSVAGAKPDFRAPMPLPAIPPLRLEANVPGNADFGEDFSHGNPFGMPAKGSAVTPEPARMAALPASAGNGEPLPMIMEKRTAPPDVFERTARTRVVPPRFAAPEIIPPARNGYAASPLGEITRRPLGVFGPTTPETLPETRVPIRPAGSEDRFFDEDLYPRGSHFAKKGK